MTARPGARAFPVKVLWVLLVERAPRDLTVSVYRTRKRAEEAATQAMNDDYISHLYRRTFMEDKE